MKNLNPFLISLIPLFLFSCSQDIDTPINQTTILSINGKVSCQNGEPMKGVEIEISENDNITDILFTDENGKYAFSNPTIGNAYQISLKYEDDQVPDTLDLQMISSLILDIGSFSSFQRLAAEANNSGSVSTFDFVELRKQIEFKTPTEWKFATENFSFPSTDFPIGEGSIGGLIIEDYQGESIIQNFIGIKMGDLDGNICTD